MKFITVLSLGLAALPELASASFASTCRNWYWEDQHYFVSECKKKDGSWMRTRQDMNLCLGLNSSNKPVPMDNGGLFVVRTKTCAFDRLEGTTLRVTCNDGNDLFNGWWQASIDLNTFVDNLDGYMWCMGHRSAPR
ncbi:hypothetical protein QBC42DRAFT_330786 [Cladorrhinum samala]|uniref:Cyanovirin-N domain-containing protein n=1 Tax=Cladorrhinum samala TaxID=585594 RepID=A0AAV9I130_9PEZI|nr:hypothetical protein QBC42DRAFT_330786 [Cladorrhinum samala]